MKEQEGWSCDDYNETRGLGCGEIVTNFLGGQLDANPDQHLMHLFQSIRHQIPQFCEGFG